MTGKLIIVFFLAALVISIMGLITACASSHLPRFTSAAFFIAAIAAIAGGIWSTYYYDYYSSPNTHMHGWPVPHVVYQRDNPESEWRDYIGPTILFALPMNWVLFLLPPSVMIIVAHFIRKKKQKRA